MRVVVDVSPLSHPRTGIGNYIRGSLAGMTAAAGGRHELVAFAPFGGPVTVRTDTGEHAISRELADRIAAS